MKYGSHITNCAYANVALSSEELAGLRLILDQSERRILMLDEVGLESLRVVVECSEEELAGMIRTAVAGSEKRTSHES